MISDAPPPASQPLDRDLRGYLETNRDVVTWVRKPVSIIDIGAVSAQSDTPVVFENIVEYPKAIKEATIMASEHVVPAGGVEKEPFIPYVAEKDYPEELKPALEPYMKRMGFIPNALKLYMHRPEIAETLWKLNSNVMRDPSSTLDQELKRRLSAICSKTNGCTYCTAHCCGMLTKPPGTSSEGWGMSRDEVTDLVRGDLEPRDEIERVCFDFAHAASADAASVPEDVFDRLKAYLTPPQIVELACVIGFWKMYNTIHDALRIPIEAHLEHDTDFVHA